MLKLEIDFKLSKFDLRLENLSVFLEVLNNIEIDVVNMMILSNENADEYINDINLLKYVKKIKLDFRESENFCYIEFSNSPDLMNTLRFIEQIRSASVESDLGVYVGRLDNEWSLLRRL